MIQVIKIGGKLIEHEQLLGELCDRLSAYYPHCILVHGGGSKAGELAARLGVGVKMYEGRRITDLKTLEITVMAYAGWANKRVVAALQARQMNACGLSGCDMGIVEAHRREIRDIDWGFVGDIDKVKGEQLRNLLNQKIMPVISPITFEQSGQLLNTNADSVAAAVAIALSQKEKVELVFCLDKSGVLKDIKDETSAVPFLDRTLYEEYRSQGFIHSGMLPKLENAFKTLEAGVATVRITCPSRLEGGTQISL